MQIGLLGPLEVREGDEIIPLGGRKQRAVLADLVINAGTPMSSDRLIDDLWGSHPPATADGTLQAYVSRLRTALGKSVVTRTSNGYQLTVASGQIDAGRFTQLIDEARHRAKQEDPAGAATRYREALALWRGRVLGELGDEHFALAEARRLTELRTEVQEELFDLELDLDDGGDLIPALQDAVTEEPFREKRWIQLMTALYRQGRQVDALRTYRQVERLFADELGITPAADLRRLEEQILLQDPRLQYQADCQTRRDENTNPTNLRETAAAFLGRGQDLARVTDLFARHHLVSIVGFGGVGKTRLAIELGWQELSRLDGGVWDIDFARENNPNRVLRAVAGALQLAERGSGTVLRRIVARVDKRETLFIFDNCEHMKEAVANTVDQLLTMCPKLRILATSREPLGLASEHVYTLEPLSLPSGRESTAADFLESPAMDLFQICGDVSHRGFRVTTSNGPTVASIVRRLDGIPLAIELAASRLSLLTPNQIAEELARGFPAYATTTDSRHSTLRSAIDWSNDLLDDREQAVLRRLAVFAGGFDAADAAPVVSNGGVPEEAVAAVIDSLAGKSLLFRYTPAATIGGSPRYAMLETIRAYALDRLAAVGEIEWCQGRHAQSMAELATEAAAHLHQREQAQWFDRLRSHRAEMDRALDTAAALDDSILGRSLCRSLWLWWYLDGLLDEAIERIDQFAGSEPDPADPDWSYLAAARGLVLSERGHGTEHVGSKDADRVMADVQLAQEHARDLDLVRKAHVDLLCGDALSSIGSHSLAEPMLDRAIDAFRDLGIDWAEGWAELRLLRLVALGKGDFAAADQLLPIAIAALDQAGDLQLLAYARLALANRARLLGRFPESLEIAGEALDLYRELGLDTPMTLAYMAESLLEIGRPRQALAIAGELRASGEAANLTSWVDVAETRQACALTRLGDTEEALMLLEGLRDRDPGIDLVASGSVLLAQVEALLTHGDVEEASTVAAEARRVCGQTGNPWQCARAQVMVGEAALASHEGAAAVAAFDSGLALYDDLHHHPPGAAACCEGLAGAARQADLPAEIAARLGTAARLRDESGARPPPLIQTRNRDLVSWSARRLGAEEFSRCWRDGEDWAIRYLEDSIWNSTLAVS